MSEKIRLGMIGGGLDSMIGDIHRYAARLDNYYELVGGVFSRDGKKSQSLGKQLGLDLKRIYPSYKEMCLAESSYTPEKRMEVVAIVTPNDSHFAIAHTALQADFHVIMDKPISCFISEANKLKKMVAQSNKLFCVTYTYAAYPMIKEARHLIQSGKLGTVRKIIVEFMQGWLSTHLEATEHKQAAWRMNPVKSGLSGTMADIGVHAFHLGEYITGLKTTHLCADIHRVVPERLLEDDGTVLLRFDHDAQGLLVASQVAAGEEANLRIRVYTEKGSLEWQHTDPNTLLIKWLGQPAQLLKLGSDNKYLHATTLHNCRTPAGHPEGYIEAFANHYRNFALCLNAIKNNLAIKAEWDDYPKIEEGVRGVAFIETVIASNQSKQKWLPLKET